MGNGEHFIQTPKVKPHAQHIFCQGLNPKTFWEHKDKLLSSDRAILVELVNSLACAPFSRQFGTTEMSLSDIPALQISPIARVKGMVSIASTSNAEVLQLSRSLQSKPPDKHDAIYITVISSSLDIVNTPASTPSDQGGGDEPLSNVLLLTIPDGKRGQMQFLQDALPRSMSFILSHLLRHRGWGGRPLRIYCACDSNSGFDRSVGIALCALQIFFDDAGELREAFDWCGSSGGMSEPRRRVG
jgi:tRNA A64-2'-O-ribosylphosphate transferase